MCIAILKPEGLSVTKETLRNCFQNNSDGAGFAIARRGKLIVRKGYFTFDKFWRAYRAETAKDNPVALIHFRIATHGTVNEDNCHPFKVSNDLAFIHNGIINISTKSDETKSDTQHFNMGVLQPVYERMGKDMFMLPAMKYLLGTSVDGSKLVFLNRRGEHSIINESDGVWVEGVWFSNTSYKKRVYTTSRYYRTNDNYGYNEGGQTSSYSIESQQERRIREAEEAAFQRYAESKSGSDSQNTSDRAWYKRFLAENAGIGGTTSTPLVDASARDFNRVTDEDDESNLDMSEGLPFGDVNEAIDWIDSELGAAEVMAAATETMNETVEPEAFNAT